MAIFNRLADILKANINDMLDKAEDPEKMLKQIVIDMDEMLAVSTQALGSLMASERSLSAQYKKAEDESSLWEQRAKEALKSGDEALAKQAVECKLKADASAEQTKKLLDETSAQVSLGRDQFNTLKAKLEEARSKQAMLISRLKVAETREKLAEAMGSTGAFGKIDAMERKVQEKEDYANAMESLSVASDNNNERYESLEHKNKADAELKRLAEEIHKGE